MEAMRDAWTDGRLDDLNQRVDGGFVEMRGEFRAVRSEIGDEFRAVRGEMRQEFQAVRADMRSMNRTFIALYGTMVIGFAGTIATILAHG